MNPDPGPFRGHQQMSVHHPLPSPPLCNTCAIQTYRNWPKPSQLKYYSVAWFLVKGGCRMNAMFCAKLDHKTSLLDRTSPRWLPVKTKWVTVPVIFIRKGDTRGRHPLTTPFSQSSLLFFFLISASTDIGKVSLSIENYSRKLQSKTSKHVNAWSQWQAASPLRVADKGLEASESSPKHTHMAHTLKVLWLWGHYSWKHCSTKTLPWWYKLVWIMQIFFLTKICLVTKTGRRCTVVRLMIPVP